MAQQTTWRGVPATKFRKEPILGVIAITAAASGNLLTQGQTYSALVDDVGESAAGGRTVVDYAQTITKGTIPTGVAYDVHGMFANVTVQGLASVLTEAKLNALAHNTVVIVHHQGQKYNLGRLANWLGPTNTVTQRAGNIVSFRKFAEPFELAPGDKFKVELRQLNNITGGVAANDVFNVDIELDATTYLLGAAAMKQ